MKTLQGYYAFVPAPPPQTLPLDEPTMVALSRADAALGELAGLGRYLPNPDLLIAPYVKREAVASSRIEGTQANLSDLLLDELAPERTSPTSDVLEVRNYIAAMRVGMDKLKPLPFAGRLVRDLHRVLMRDVMGEYATPGEYRTTQNWIGPAGSNLNTAKYVPPPVDEMHECLRQWEVFVNTRGQMPELVQCALMHEHFEAIHPFIDGNGRVGRLLIPLFLMERRRLSRPLLYLSAFIEQHRTDYYELLNAVRTRGAWLEWVRYFLTGISDSARAAVRQADAVLALRTRLLAKLEGKHRARALLEELFINPYITIPRAAVLLKISDTTAANPQGPRKSPASAAGGGGGLIEFMVQAVVLVRRAVMPRYISFERVMRREVIRGTGTAWAGLSIVQSSQT
jgi:Fic family protein